MHREERGRYLIEASAFHLPAGDKWQPRLTMTRLAFANALSNLFGQAIEETQHRLSAYGLLFAVLSLAFSSFAVLDVVNARPHHERIWVLAALAVIAFVFALAPPLVRRWFRRSYTTAQARPR